MIRKLRIKLIIASMVSLLAVLLVIMSAVNLVYYGQVIQEADSTLALLAANDGFFPKIQPRISARREIPQARAASVTRTAL